MTCEKCGKTIAEDERCYQVRYGYIQDGEFVPEEDVTIICEECGVERGNYTSYPSSTPSPIKGKGEGIAMPKI